MSTPWPKVSAVKFSHPETDLTVASLFANADIEQRVRALAVDAGAAATADHSFAERAENYYHKRPQLLALLTDLHRRYLYLADRYAQTVSVSVHGAKHKQQQQQQQHATAASDCCSSSSDVDDDDDGSRCSDADSSLSFQLQQQQPQPHPAPAQHDPELVVAELVLAWVDREVLADDAARRRAEAARRVELQGSLLEVLESERLVLLGENARLALRASAAAAELGYARRRAAEAARLVARLREDHHRAGLLGRGRVVEALRAQVRALELRDRGRHEAVAAARREAGAAAAAEVQRLRADNRRLAEEAAAAAAAARRKGRGGGWWSRVRTAAEWTPCAPAAAVGKVGRRMKGEDGKHYGGGGGGGGGCFCIY
jgi:hypothetical protein